MPKLGDFRKTKVVTLPSFPDSTVEIYDGLLVGDMVSFGGSTEGKELELMLLVIPKMIKSWNFTDEKDQPLPITRENLNFMKPEDLTFLLNEVTLFTAETKKK